LRRPTLALAIALNQPVRQPDEWFDEPDDLERIESALESISSIEDVVVHWLGDAPRLALLPEIRSCCTVMLYERHPDPGLPHG